MSSEPRLANLATELVRREQVAIDPPSAEVEARITATLASAIEIGRAHV